MLLKSVRHLAATFILLQATSLGTVAQLQVSENVTRSRITGLGLSRFGMTKQQLEAALKTKLTLKRGQWALRPREIKKYNPRNYITVRATQADLKKSPELVFTRKDKVKVRYWHDAYLLRNLAVGNYRYDAEYGFMGNGGRLDRITISTTGKNLDTAAQRAVCSNTKKVFQKLYGVPTKKTYDNFLDSSTFEWKHKKASASVSCFYTDNGGSVFGGVYAF